MGAFSLTPSGPFNLTVEVRFTPVVRGPHLIYAREEFVSLEVALRAGPSAPTADDAERGRGSYLGGLVPGSPFEHLVRHVPAVAIAAAGAAAAGAAAAGAVRSYKATAAGGRTVAPRACVAADFADLSHAAFVAPDAGTLALPRSQWRLSPRGCTVARHALDCDGMASCLRTRRISLMGDSMMERLRSGWHKLPWRATVVSLCGERRKRGEPAWPGCRPCGSQRRDRGTPLLARRPHLSLRGPHFSTQAALCFFGHAASERTHASLGGRRPCRVVLHALLELQPALPREQTLVQQQRAGKQLGLGLQPSCQYATLCIQLATPRAQLDLTECDETFRMSRDDVARCRGRANTSARQIFADFRLRHAEARAVARAAAGAATGAAAGTAARVAAGAAVGTAARAAAGAAGAAAGGRLAKAAAAAAAAANALNVAAAAAKLAPECGATLVLNLGGLHTAAWGGELTMAGYGGAVRTAIRLALRAGFEHVICLATAAAHPVAYPPLESMPALLFGLNAQRTHRTAELAAAVAAEFPCHPMSKTRWHRLRPQVHAQVALQRLLSALDRASSCPKLQLTSANQLVGPRWPATLGLYPT